MASGMFIEAASFFIRLKFRLCPCKSPVIMTSSAESSVMTMTFPCLAGRLEIGLCGLVEYGNDFFDVLIGSNHDLFYEKTVSKMLP